MVGCQVQKREWKRESYLHFHFPRRHHLLICMENPKRRLIPRRQLPTFNSFFSFFHLLILIQANRFLSYAKFENLIVICESVC
ncbi:unnamed protein product [Lactuca virosa]|uniref:Uncharacterized protein n=1 Tax=Lactuca virosa TaxID=75947 RepID=A0AAU9PMW9_9ASTR|nr:unnamed protein product [Lactuca virosa]